MFQRRLSSTLNTLYNLREVTKQDLPKLNSFIEKNFLREEPIFKSLIAKATDREIADLYEDHAKLIEAINSSFPAIIAETQDTKKIVLTAIFNGHHNPKFPQGNFVNAYDLYQPRTKIMAESMLFTKMMLNKSNLYEHFPNARHSLELYVGAVDQGLRNRNLSSVIVSEFLARATRMGFSVAWSISASPGGIRSLEKIGLRSILDYDLTEYRDENGNALLPRDSMPLDKAVLMAISLGNEEKENVRANF